MGLDPDFDRDGFAKGGRNHSRSVVLAVLFAMASLAMIFVIYGLRSESLGPPTVTIAAPVSALPLLTPPEPPPYHLIVNRETGYCLDVPHCSEELKTPVEQFPVNGGGNQRWRLEAVPGDAVRIVNEHTGKCLDVPNGTAEPNVAVEQYSIHDGPNQRWWLEETGDGWYRIVNQLTGLCLQVAGESHEKRARIEQARPGDSPYQQWRTISVR